MKKEREKEERGGWRKEKGNKLPPPQPFHPGFVTGRLDFVNAHYISKCIAKATSLNKFSKCH
jgi:hypothetical protein